MAEKPPAAWVPVKAPITIPIYCGGCINLATRAIRTGPDGKPATCSALGITEKSKTCKDFSLNTQSTTIRELVQDRTLAKLLKRVGPSALASLSAALVGEIDTRKHGFHFGQRVYVNIMSRGDNAPNNDRDYVANYYMGEVVSIDPDGMAHVAHKRISINIGVSALLTKDEWHERRALLLSAGKLVDKDNPYSWSRRDLKVLRDPTTRPPWLNAALAEYLTSRPIDDFTPTMPIKRGRGRPKKVATRV